MKIRHEAQRTEARREIFGIVSEQAQLPVTHTNMLKRASQRVNQP